MLERHEGGDAVARADGKGRGVDGEVFLREEGLDFSGRVQVAGRGENAADGSPDEGGNAVARAIFVRREMAGGHATVGMQDALPFGEEARQLVGGEKLEKVVGLNPVVGVGGEGQREGVAGGELDFLRGRVAADFLQRFFQHVRALIKERDFGGGEKCADVVAEKNGGGGATYAAEEDFRR
ncbi:MAG: hypothetical protein RLZZ350_1999 [Verrucomicrobiota bacterium]